MIRAPAFSVCTYPGQARDKRLARTAFYQKATLTERTRA